MIACKFYHTQFDLNAALADYIAQAIVHAIAERGYAAIAISGGKTPKEMLVALGQIPLAWQKVFITLADERWTTNDLDTNAYLLQNSLLKNWAQAARFVPLKNNAMTPHEGQGLCEVNLSQLPPTLDLIVLGMGEDGHTASLFPHALELEFAMQTTQRCAAITPITAPHLRMTLSAAYLTQSREAIIHITGANKKLLFNQYCAPAASRPYLPIYRILSAINAKKTLFWAP